MKGRRRLRLRRGLLQSPLQLRHLCEPCLHKGPFLAPQGSGVTSALDNSTAPLPCPRFPSSAACKATRPVGGPDSCPALSSQASVRRARNSSTLTCVCVLRSTCATPATLMSSAYLSQSAWNCASGKPLRAKPHKLCPSSLLAINSAVSLSSASSGIGSSAARGAALC